MSQTLYDLPEGWEWKQLKDVAFSIRNTVEPLENYIYHYVGLENIQSNTGVLIDFMPTDGKDISSTKVAFKKDSVLFGKLRPYLNKVYVAEFDGIATTEIIPFQCTNSLSPKFLAHYMRTGFFISWAMANCSGARMPRATSKFFDELAYVPLPPLAEQTRIVEKLDAVLSRIDTAIDELQQSRVLVDAMFKSGLEGCFRLDGIKQVLLSDIATVGRGVSKHRPRNDSSLFGGNYPFIQTGDVRNAQKYIKKYSASYSDKGLAQSKLWKKGTICLTIAANIGDVAILDLDACFPDSVVGIYSETESNEYLYYFLSTLQSYLDLKANAAAQKNINLKILSEIEVPLPSLDRQQEIVDYLNALNDKTTQLKTEITAKIGMFNQLKASVLDGAFRGEV